MSLLKGKEYRTTQLQIMAMHGTSLLVPSVQELAKQPIIEVPERYVRPNQDPPILSNTTSFPGVPVLDLHKLLSQDEIELEKLDHACKQWGFFQVPLFFSFNLFYFSELKRNQSQT